MAHKQLNAAQREKIYELKQLECRQDHIAKRVGCSQSAVSREIKRNTTESMGYLPDSADKTAKERRAQAKEKVKKWYEYPPLLKYVVDKLICKSYYSPEQITGRMKIDYPDDEKMRVSHEYIYQYIWNDKKQGGELWKNLRQSHKKKKKRYGKKDNRGVIPNKKSIDERPKEVDTKERYGDFEGDLIIGHNHKGAINTQVERKSKLLRAIIMARKTAKEMVQSTIQAYADIPKELLKTMTYDNGTEMADHEEIAEKLGIDVYFAHPYHSWERGLNENTNGLLRQYFPKKTDFTKITQTELDEVVEAINNRPRKTLNYRTPNEVFEEIKLCVSG
jgi:transposase, IS30 family